MASELAKTTDTEIEGMMMSIAVVGLVILLANVFLQAVAEAPSQYSPYSTEGAALWLTKRL